MTQIEEFKHARFFSYSFFNEGVELGFFDVKILQGFRIQNLSKLKSNISKSSGLHLKRAPDDYDSEIIFKIT